MKIPVAIKILNEATGPKANVEFMDVSILKNGKQSKEKKFFLNETNQYQYCIVFLLLAVHQLKRQSLIHILLYSDISACVWSVQSRYNIQLW